VAEHTEIRRLGLGGNDGAELRSERLVATGRRRFAVSNGVAHTKFNRVGAAARHGQHTEIRELFPPVIYGAKFRSKHGSNGRRRIAVSNGVVHTKFKRIDAAARHGQHTEIRRLGLGGNDGSKFRSKDW